MKSSLINIGKSRGIILPDDLLKECHINKEVKIEVIDNQIIISNPENIKRAGWEKAFQEMAVNGDDQLIVPDLFADENIADWTFNK